MENKVKKIVLGIGVTFAALGLSAGAVKAANYVQKSNALNYYRDSSLRIVNDSNVHFVKAPNYAWAKNPSGSNTISSESGTPWTFKTQYLLPHPDVALGSSDYNFTNPQSAARAGKYLYVVYSPHQLNGKGFIVRYDTSELSSLGLEKSSNLTVSRDSSAMKVSKIFQVGHGQSLAYNPKAHELWMWRDRGDMKGGPTNTVQRISTSTLMPNKSITFKMSDGGAYIPGGHDLTFDNHGTALYWEMSSGHVKIYKMNIGSKSVKVTLTKQLFKNGTGTHEQSIGFNSHNGRVYIVSDDSIASFPESKTNGNGSLTSKDFKYTRFNSKREFESLFFVGGHGMLLSNKNPEVFRSTTAY